MAGTQFRPSSMVRVGNKGRIVDKEYPKHLTSVWLSFLIIKTGICKPMLGVCWGLDEKMHVKPLVVKVVELGVVLPQIEGPE